MKTTNRNTKTGSWRDSKKGSGAKPWEQGSAHVVPERRIMHKAICSDCNKSCEVPFKPTGNKPILCTACFQGISDQKRGRPSSFNKFNASDRSSRKSESGYANRGGTNYDEQFRILNAKLDTILRSLH